MFPPLCVPAADGVEADSKNADDYLSPGGDKLVKGGKKYVVKFKLLEIYEEIREKHRG